MEELTELIDAMKSTGYYPIFRNQLEAAEARAAQLSEENGMLIKEIFRAADLLESNRELSEALGIVRAERDRANTDCDYWFSQYKILQARLEAVNATGKSNGEMWAQADALYKRAEQEKLEMSETIGRLQRRVDELEVDRITYLRMLGGAS